MQTLPTMIISTHFQKYTQKHTSSPPKWTVQCFLLLDLKNVIVRNLRVFFTACEGVVVHWTFYWKDSSLYFFIWCDIAVYYSVQKFISYHQWEKRQIGSERLSDVNTGKLSVLQKSIFLIFEKLIPNYLTLVGFTYGAFTRFLTPHPTPTK